MCLSLFIPPRIFFPHFLSQLLSFFILHLPPLLPYLSLSCISVCVRHFLSSLPLLSSLSHSLDTAADYCDDMGDPLLAALISRARELEDQLRYIYLQADIDTDSVPAAGSVHTSVAHTHYSWVIIPFIG